MQILEEVVDPGEVLGVQDREGQAVVVRKVHLEDFLVDGLEAPSLPVQILRQNRKKNYNKVEIVQLLAYSR